MHAVINIINNIVAFQAGNGVLGLGDIEVRAFSASKVAVLFGDDNLERVIPGSRAGVIRHVIVRSENCQVTYFTSLTTALKFSIKVPGLQP